jgi:hypothetical protein
MKYLKFLKNNNFIKSVFSNLLAISLICILICVISSLIRNVDLLEMQNSNYEFTSYNNEPINNRIKEIQKICGEGYATGWWKIYEFDGKLKNIDIFTHKTNPFYRVENDTIYSIKQKRLNLFYNYPYTLSRNVLDYVSIISKSSKIAEPVYCSNLNKCLAQDNILVKGLIHGSFTGIKKSELNSDFFHQTQEEINYIFKNTDYPLIELTYIIVDEKAQPLGQKSYIFFHISKISTKNNVCNQKIATQLLIDLVRNLK